ncbi:MAG: 23S rRNA (uracil(1939)-C(5))-methyltransferase RlmD [Clostridiales bacterium]|jgi:23S rRNA (uracil-5-)-methyltransferase RumA|nr:23S rRNA (uracil(1939)-C(5))-methyltransferase RlmD [Clostridiales bacterium]
MARVFETEIEITDALYPNLGIAFQNAVKIAVKNTLPGQIVRARVKFSKKGSVGKATQIIKHADYEITPRCADFGFCGGCVYQNLTYEKEIELKEKTVLNLLSQNDVQGFEYLGIIPSPCKAGYKNKMEFSFGDSEKGGILQLGMHKRGAYYEVVTPQNCNIADGDFKKIADFTLDFFRKEGESFYHKMMKTGSLRHLVIRKAAFTGEIMVNIVTSSFVRANLNKFAQNLAEIKFDGKLCSVVHTVNNSSADAVICEELHLLCGRGFITENLLGLKFKITPFSFFQTNSHGAEKLYETVRDYAGNLKDKTALDLYCGTGTITQILSPCVKKITGIEIVPEAVNAAKENVLENGITNCDFICGDVLSQINDIAEKPHLVVLDPPREGVHPKAITKIIGVGAAKIIYVSCNPVTLVRDLRIFTEAGYMAEKITLCDMFPRTAHAETVCLLKGKNH